MSILKLDNVSSSDINQVIMVFFGHLLEARTSISELVSFDDA